MNLAKYKNAGNFILLAGIFLCCLYALHDMQTAEGVGLLFAMKLGMEQRLPMDVVVDIVAIAALAVLVYLPCLLLKHKTTEAYLRLFIGYLAVVPQLSLAKVIALCQADQRVFVWDVGVVSALESWVYNLLPFLQTWIPLFILLFATAKVNRCFSLGKRHGMILALMAVVGIMLLLVPSAENLLLYVMGYLGLLIAFDCWEALFAAMPQMKKWYRIIFVFLLLKGVYRIMVLVSQV